MNAPAKKLAARAAYRDLEAVPPNKVAELVGGVLHVMPRPAPRHARASSRLGVKLGGPFDLGEGGPGGWVILDEPELHFPDPTQPGETDAVVPDLAGWRRERLPQLPETAYFELAPDWICEVLSPSTEDFDRNTKMPVYAREGVRHAWLIDPIKQTLELYRLNLRRRWSKPVVVHGPVCVRLPPFDALDLDLSTLWAEGDFTAGPVKRARPRAKLTKPTKRTVRR